MEVFSSETRSVPPPPELKIRTMESDLQAALQGNLVPSGVRISPEAQSGTRAGASHDPDFKWIVFGSIVGVIVIVGIAAYTVFYFSSK